MKANLSRLLSRGSLHKTYVNAALWTKKKSHNYINDTEIEVQRRRTAGWKGDLITPNTLVKLFYNCLRTINVGTGGNKSLPAPEEEFGEGTSHADFTAGIDFTILSLSAISLFRFNTSWNGQWNGTPLTQQDKFSIGGRYTVRGFDGIAFRWKGWLWRNELGWNIANKGHELYLGIDRGKVHSSQEELQIGDS